MRHLCLRARATLPFGRSYLTIRNPRWVTPGASTSRTCSSVTPMPRRRDTRFAPRCHRGTRSWRPRRSSNSAVCLTVALQRSSAVGRQPWAVLSAAQHLWGRACTSCWPGCSAVRARVVPGPGPQAGDRACSRLPRGGGVPGRRRLKSRAARRDRRAGGPLEVGSARCS